MKIDKVKKQGVDVTLTMSEAEANELLAKIVKMEAMVIGYARDYAYAARHYRPYPAQYDPRMEPVTTEDYARKRVMYVSYDLRMFFNKIVDAAQSGDT